MMGRETFTDHEGNEAPDFEIEEIEEGDGKPDKDKGKKDDEGDDARQAARKRAEGDDEGEEIEDEEDEEKETLRAENARLRQQSRQNEVDKTKGEKEQAEYLSKALDQKIAEIRNSLVEAKKDEDVEKQAKLENELEQAKDAKKQADELAVESGKKLEDLNRRGDGDRGGQPGSPVTGKARDWVRKNPWYNDPEHKRKRQMVGAIDRELVSENYDPNSDRYFKELSKRMAKEFPDLPVKYLDGNAVVKSQRKPGGDGRRGVHANPGTKGSTSPRSPSRPTLEPEDKVKMRKFGMDPANKNDVKHFLRAKAETAAEEERRRGE